jgi:outer membrane protein OmpA-like peptidoglycan-associated protein
MEARAPEQQKLDNLLQEVKRLTTELATAQEQAKHTNDAQQTTEALRVQLAQGDAALAQKTTELTAAQSRITELRQDLSHLNQARQAVEQRLSSAEQEHAKQRDDSLKTTEALRAQLVHAEISLAQKSAELSTAQSRIEDLRQQVSGLEQSRQDVQQRLSASEMTARQTQDALIATESAKSAATEQAANLSAQVQELQAQLTARIKEIADLSGRVALIPGIENRLTIAMQEREQRQGEVEKLKEEYAIARTRGEDANAEITRLRTSIENEQRELTAARNTYANAEQHANQLKGQVDAMQQELVRAGTEREQMRVQLADMSGQRGTLQTQLASMTRLKEDADSRVAKLSNDLSALQSELSQTMDARNVAQSQAKMLADKLGAAQKEIDNLTLARADVESRASNLRQQLSTTTDQVLDLSEEVRHLRDQVRGQDLTQLSTLPNTLTKGVTFDHRRTTLSEDSKKLLDEAAAILQRYPEVKVSIEGYTDSVGKPDFNRVLSERRANVVRDYLIERGIEVDRLVAVGRGEENPIVSNATPYGRALNRRIEFHLSQLPDTGEVGTAAPATQATDKPIQLDLQQPPERR